MQRGGRSHEVRRVAVGEERPGAEGEGPAVVLHGGLLAHVRVLLEHGGLLALLVLVGHFSVARLNAVLLHGERPVDLRGGDGKHNQSVPLCERMRVRV